MEVQEVGAHALQIGRRQAIKHLVCEIALLPQPLKPEDCPVRHFFAPGSYTREITMPARIIVVGKIHKHAHVNLISKGRVRVFTEQAGEEVLVAPCTFVSHAYTQRVVWVEEETVWTTFHVTDKTDLAEIERDLIAEDFEE